MDQNTQTILVFNADLQRESPHTLTIDGNGEVILTCTENGRFLKFPKGTTADELRALLTEHKNANEGQISVASIEAAQEELISALAGTEPDTSATPQGPVEDPIP
jgi:hypothetical protein